MEKVVEKPTVQFLLTQAYAVHRQTVVDLEAKLKAQEDLNRNSSCNECHELRKALAASRGKYSDALVKQKELIDSLEKRLLAIQEFHNSKVTSFKSIGVQTTDNFQESNVICIGSAQTSTSGRSRKHLSGNRTSRLECKRQFSDTSSDVSCSLLKNESPRKSQTIRMDFLPVEKMANPEPEVLIPESPLNDSSSHGRRTLDLCDALKILSSHKKVHTWLNNMEVPETVPQELFPEFPDEKREDLTMMIEDFELVNSEPEVLTLNSTRNDKNGPLKIKADVERVPSLVSSPNSCKLLSDGIFYREKHLGDGKSSPLLLAVDRNRTARITRSQQKTKETVHARSGEKMMKQTKIKLNNICGKKDPATVAQDKLTPSASSHDNFNHVADVTGTFDLKTSKSEVMTIPEGKENVNKVNEDSRSDVLPEKNSCKKASASMRNLDDSFDEVPKKKEKYKMKEATVRGRAARDELPGQECDYCLKYYNNLDLTEEEKKERLKFCSRHRSKHSPPTTPEHYWEIGFPDTPECIARGYLEATQCIQLKPRRRRPLNCK